MKYNLLEEVLAIFEAEELSYLDIIWCGSTNFCSNWENFRKVAEVTDYEYKNQLAQDLLIVANGWYMELNVDETDPIVFDIYITPIKPSVGKEIKYLSCITSKNKELFPDLINLN